VRAAAFHLHWPEHMKDASSDALNSVQEMLKGFMERLPYIVLGLIIFFIFYFAAKGVRSLMRRFAAGRQSHLSLALVLGRIAQSTIIFVGLLIALVIAIPGFTPGQLISVLGIGTVAIGFAFRDILQNFLAGILLLLSEPFRIGDQIVFGDFEGTVEDIQTRATMMRTYDNKRIVIPNSKLFTESVTVNTAYEKRRLEYDFGIGYSDDIDLAKKIMLEQVKKSPALLDDPAPDVLVMELADSSINIRLRWWVSPPNQAESLKARDIVLQNVRQAFAEAGIDIPFPMRTVLFHDQTDETDGVRSNQREGWPPPREGDDPAPARLGLAMRKTLGDTSES
jgi:small-conductance mechanosensitive channel